MNIGWLRHRLTIQEKGSITLTTLGEEEITWTDVGTYWASVEPLRGREYLARQVETAEITTRIRLRYPGTDITPEMRAQCNGHTYNIRQVINVLERDKMVELMCTEVL